MSVTKHLWEGLPVLCLRSIDYGLCKLSRGRARLVPYAFYAQPVPAQGLDKVPDDERTRIAIAAAGNPILEHFPRPAQVIERRLSSGAVCWAASVEGEFAGYIWIRPGWYDEDEVRCRYLLPERCAWDFDVYVAPKFRLGRTMARLWKTVGHSLQSQSVAWTFSRISLFNRASLSSHQRLGAKRVGAAVFLVLGQVQVAFMSGAPFMHLGLTSQPVIRLQPPPRLSQRGVDA